MEEPIHFWQDPPARRLWIWFLNHHAFSWPFAMVAAAGAYHVLFDETEINVGTRSFSVHTVRDWGDWLVWVALILLTSTLAGALRFLEDNTAQKARDRQANAILQAVQAGNEPVFSVYLRPFLLTRKMGLKNPRHGAIPALVKYHSEEKRLDFETLLEPIMRKSGPLIALGQPGEMIGAGRLAVPEDKWKLRFQTLVPRADCILVIPSYTEGTRWEIGWLRDQNLLSKCVFIMPPKPMSKMDMEKLWGQAARSMRELEIQLPEYSAAGMFFSLDQSGQVQRSTGINSISALQSSLIKFRAGPG